MTSEISRLKGTNQLKFNRKKNVCSIFGNFNFEMLANLLKCSFFNLNEIKIIKNFLKLYQY